jgi:hypothetical protein
MAGNQARLSIQGATDEILRRQGARPAQLQPRAAAVDYGQFPAPWRNDLEDLRRQQVAFRKTTEGLDRRNSWMAIPALAPVAAVVAAETAAMLAARAAAAGVGSARQPLNLLDREPWWRNSRPPRPPLTALAKNAIRRDGRNVWARANNKVQASELDAHVHHSDPLEWAHLNPKADPNRLANLWPLSPEEHVIATREWSKFGRAFKDRDPTPAELMEAKMRIDKLVGPLVRRPGAARPNPPPKRRP